MERLKWTHETPTKQGWYFTRRDIKGGSLRVMWVGYEYFVQNRKLLRVFGMGETKRCNLYPLQDLKQPDRIWAGPIPEPEKEEERK